MSMQATDGGRLGPGERQAALERMADEVMDVVIVGGGITGAGTALDAATRGLSVALVEAGDFAAGTSSRSSKLIHGGLRYLEQLNFALVREALRERGLLLTRLAPHLVRPVSFLYPLRHRYWERFYVGAGVLLYDTMGGARALPRHRHLSRRAALRLAPALRPDALVGAVRYYDGQVDDARHTLVTARTAARYGALLATSARATGLLRDGDRVTGIRVRDLESGRDLEVRGRQVVSATGVWTDELTAQVGGGQYRVRMSKGIHFTVPADRIRSGTGLILRTEKSVLFVIPWGRLWIVGTTDTDWDLDRVEPAATQADLDYLLEHVNRVLADPLTRDDVVSVYVGLRPLLAGSSASTAQLSREHAVFRPAPGLVAERPALAEPLPGGQEYLAAEAVYAASHEGALHLDDVLVRRTRIAMEAADRGLAAADPVSRHLAGVLGWAEDRRLREVGAYPARVEAERAAERQPDDLSADAVRRREVSAPTPRR